MEGSCCDTAMTANESPETLPMMLLNAMQRDASTCEAFIRANSVSPANRTLNICTPCNAPYGMARASSTNVQLSKDSRHEA